MKRLILAAMLAATLPLSLTLSLTLTQTRQQVVLARTRPVSLEKLQ